MGPGKTLCYGLVALYRLTLGQFVGGHCRFSPSCSAYAQDALRAWPLGYALRQTGRRLSKCHPWHPGGQDPVFK